MLLVYVLCTLVYLASFSNLNIHSFTYQKKRKKKKERDLLKHLPMFLKKGLGASPFRLGFSTNL